MNKKAVVDHDELARKEIAEGETDDVESEFVNMDEEEFESFLTEAICEYAEENSAPSPGIASFDEAGLLTENHGLVVHIGEAEFHVTIIRSR